MIDRGLLTPGYSAREAAKQMILLEDHLACPGKRCEDCVHKHRLAAEAFCEEALQLDPGEKHPWLRDVARRARALERGADVRSLRKDLTQRLREEGMGSIGQADSYGAPYPLTNTCFALPAGYHCLTPSGLRIGGPKVPMGRRYDSRARYGLGAEEERVEGVPKTREPWMTEEDARRLAQEGLARIKTSGGEALKAAKTAEGKHLLGWAVALYFLFGR